ncbi:hypothetical protein BJY04DRAFT_230540 [Aspergillus karnatakaensis]|uniref:putative LysM domain protein n=1 Tax=Aspergillus karnatakaensis TaxID=1810916 RepID=UPI003CCE0458
MVQSRFLLPAILGLAQAASLRKRFSNGDFAIGETDPDVSTGCTYWANSISSSDTCAKLESYYGITISHLVSWNPSLSSDDCSLNDGWSYCVEAPAVKPTSTTSTSTTISATTSTTFPTTTTTSTDPSPTQTGLIASCDAYYFVEKGDYCQEIVDSFGNFTLPQFYSWNPAIGDSYKGLQAGYYVCVGVAGSSSPSVTTAITTSAPTATNIQQPQQPGLTSSCNDYYFVESGDTCAEIASSNSITLSKFYAWNPAVGSSCAGLQAGYYVCVGVAGSSPSTTTKAPTTTTTEPPATTTSESESAPTPTQAGLTPSYTTLYKAQQGDSCWTITTEKYSYLSGNNLFYDWNPAVGSDCSNLQAGYYYCVATVDQAPMPDTIDSCSKWHLVSSGDSCWSIEQEHGVYAAEFARWNPYVGSGCEALWLGYFVCVGV